MGVVMLHRLCLLLRVRCRLVRDGIIVTAVVLQCSYIPLMEVLRWFGYVGRSILVCYCKHLRFRPTEMSCDDS
jgi:hypothetical protein